MGYNMLNAAQNIVLWLLRTAQMTGDVDHTSGWALNLETISAMFGDCQHNT